MRIPTYLSPTSINLYTRSVEDFYLRYLTDHRQERDPQTEPMAIGSAFDAYAKSYLHEKLFGAGNDPAYDLRTLFEVQVEKQHWDWAWIHGAEAFRMYRESGALADLLIQLNKAVGEPVFEVSLEGVIKVERDGISNLGVNFLGKPDLYFINGLGNPVIIDWKVNGWFAKAGASPKRGYLKLRHGSKHRGLDKDMHRDCQPMMDQGMMINVGLSLDMVDEQWATQLSIYAWLCGSSIGSKFIVGLDQLVCKPSGGEYPELRIAEHRLKVSPVFQWEVFLKAQEMWEVIHSDHIFRDRSKEESQKLCETLDAKSKMMCELSGSQDPKDRAFLEMTRESW